MTDIERTTDCLLPLQRSIDGRDTTGKQLFLLHFETKQALRKRARHFHHLSQTCIRYATV